MRLGEPVYISEKFINLCRDYYTLWSNKSPKGTGIFPTEVQMRDIIHVEDSRRGSGGYQGSSGWVDRVAGEQLVYLWLFFVMHYSNYFTERGAGRYAEMSSFLEAQGFTPKPFTFSIEMWDMISKLIKSDFRNTIDPSGWSWAENIFTTESRITRFTKEGIPNYILIPNRYPYFMNWNDENPLEVKG